MCAASRRACATAADPDPAPLDIALHGPGRFNIPDIAIHLWRWQSLAGDRRARVRRRRRPVHVQPPRPRHAAVLRAAGRARSFSSLTARLDVPQPIAPARACHAFYGPAGSILLTADGAPVDGGQICGANLSDRPGGSWCTVASGKIAIDPELGRIQFAADVPLPQSLRLNYLLRLPRRDRRRSLRPLPRTDAARPRGRATSSPSSARPTSPPSKARSPAGTSCAAGSSGLIVLPGFESLTIDLTGAAAIQLPAGSSLVHRGRGSRSRPAARATSSGATPVSRSPATSKSTGVAGRLPPQASRHPPGNC